MDTFERTNVQDSANLQKPNDSSVNCDTNFDIHYEPLSPDTDDVLQAIEKADNRPPSRESTQICIHARHTMDDTETTNDQFGRRRSKRLALHNDDVGGKRKRIVNQENHALNSKVCDENFLI